MSERATPPAPVEEQTATAETPAPSDRDAWPREDDELLLLDEIEDETPDDNISSLV
jgi:hypothetical protein